MLWERVLPEQRFRRFMGLHRKKTLPALELLPRDSPNGLHSLDTCTSRFSTIFNRFKLYDLRVSTVAFLLRWRVLWQQTGCYLERRLLFLAAG
uniref:Uncharacterized protein n=1 Tax=Mesocestoides corti TaxID=53468 RepID=A0A5K3EZQ7_MESCO